MDFITTLCRKRGELYLNKGIGTLNCIAYSEKSIKIGAVLKYFALTGLFTPSIVCHQMISYDFFQKLRKMQVILLTYSIVVPNIMAHLQGKSLFLILLIGGQFAF